MIATKIVTVDFHVLATKLRISEFVGRHIFASWEANFASTMFPEVGKLGNIDRKHNA